MVEVATGSKGTRAIRTEYPVEEGLIAGTTKLKETDFFLESEEPSKVSELKKVGID